MIFNIELDDKVDLSTFCAMYFDLYGKELSTYNLSIDDLVFRIEVIPLPPYPSALTKIGIFENTISTAPKPQINPCQDIRFCNFSIVQESFLGSEWIKYYNADKAYSVIESLIKTAHKVNKLKAFL